MAAGEAGGKAKAAKVGFLSHRVFLRRERFFCRFTAGGFFQLT
jgi:hypothetical protein